MQEWVNCPLPPLEDPSVILTSPQFPKKVQEDIKSKQYKNTLQQKAIFCPNFRLTRKKNDQKLILDPEWIWTQIGFLRFSTKNIEKLFFGQKLVYCNSVQVSKIKNIS